MNLNDQRVALDLESVLADIHAAFVSEYEKRTGNTIFSDKIEWGFGECQYDYQTYMEITGSNWKHRPEMVPPTEPDLAGRVGAIHDRVGQLDIVTAREGFNQTLQAWLDGHGVGYDNFVVSSEVDHKAELPYDIFIDDKPHLAEQINQGDKDEQYLLVYDQPWNEKVRENLNITRVDSLIEACFIIERKFAPEQSA